MYIKHILFSKQDNTKYTLDQNQATIIRTTEWLDWATAEEEFSFIFFNLTQDWMVSHFDIFKYEAAQQSTFILIINVSWAENQHIRMISEGSCDTDDCNDNDAVMLKIQLWSQE